MRAHGRPQSAVAMRGEAFTERGLPGVPESAAAVNPGGIDGLVIELHRRGLDANKAGDTRGALGFFLQAHAIRPDHIPYCLSAANMLLKLGEPTHALELYARAEVWPHITRSQRAMVQEKREAALAVMSQMAARAETL